MLKLLEMVLITVNDAGIHKNNVKAGAKNCNDYTENDKSNTSYEKNINLDAENVKRKDFSAKHLTKMMLKTTIITLKLSIFMLKTML